MSELWAGPWCGEFGFEITTWQAHVRKRARGFKKVVVGCRRESRALYVDFADTFWDVPNKTWHDMNTNCDKRVDRHHVHILNKFKRDVPDSAELMPTKGGRAGGLYRQFGQPTKGMDYDLLLHARWMRKGSVGGDMRRCAPQDWWDCLGQRLMNNGYNVASIGLKSQALHVEGTHDIRGAPLGALMNVMASSRCILGPSSGPIHLAAHCKLPAICWTDKTHKGYGGLTNQQRLMQGWNPFSTPISLIHVKQQPETNYWVPLAHEVLNYLEDMLDAQTGPDVATYGKQDPLGAGEVQ